MRHRKDSKSRHGRNDLFIFRTHVSRTLKGACTSKTELYIHARVRTGKEGYFLCKHMINGRRCPDSNPLTIYRRLNVVKTDPDSEVACAGTDEMLKTIGTTHLSTVELQRHITGPGASSTIFVGNGEETSFQSLESMFQQLNKYKKEFMKFLHWLEDHVAEVDHETNGQTELSLSWRTCSSIFVHEQCEEHGVRLHILGYMGKHGHNFPAIIINTILVLLFWIPHRMSQMCGTSNGLLFWATNSDHHGPNLYSLVVQDKFSARIQ